MTRRIVTVAAATVVLLVASALLATKDLMSPSPDVAERTMAAWCRGEGGPSAPLSASVERWWDDAAVLASADGPARAIQARLVDPAVPARNASGAASRNAAVDGNPFGRDEYLVARFVTAGGTGPGTPLIMIDSDGDRLHGVWSYETPVSASAWDLHVDAEGSVWRHVGQPHEWRWQQLDVPDGFRWVSQAGVTVLCVPPGLVASSLAEVRLAMDFDDVWLPATFLGGVSLADPVPGLALADDRPAVGQVATDVPADASQRQGSDHEIGKPLRQPSRLAFAYQWAPWHVRECPQAPVSVACAVEVYRAFGHVVFGGGIEDATHPSHADTAALITALRAADPDIEIWGYVSLRRHAGIWHDNDEVARRAAAWRRMGVTGIFLDEFDLCETGWPTCPTNEVGVPIEISRQRQNDAVAAIHALDLAVFANAHSVHGALGEVRGEPSLLAGPAADRAGDMYLLENPTLHAGRFWSGLDRLAGLARFRDAQRYAAASGVRLAVVDTDAGWVDDDADATDNYAASWWRAVMAGAAAHAYTNPAYSASDAMGPNLAMLQPPPTFADIPHDARFVGDVMVEENTASWRRLADGQGRLIGQLLVRADRDAVVADVELAVAPTSRASGQ